MEPKIMEPRWIAAIVAWVAVGATTAACAFAWGPDGKYVVLVLGLVGFLFASVTTSTVGSVRERKGGERD